MNLHSTPPHRTEDILPRLSGEPINRKYFVLASMCESYSGPIKSDPIKRSRLYFHYQYYKNIIYVCLFVYS